MEKEFDFGYNIETETGVHLITNYLSYTDKLGKIKAKNSVRFRMDKLPLAAGTYNVTVRFVVIDKGEVMILNVGKINVIEGPFFVPHLTIHQEHIPLYSYGDWEVE